MPLSSVTLVQRLEEYSKQNVLPPSPGKLLPHHGRMDYYANYITFANELKTHVHSQVNQTAMQIDGGYLTNHGIEHINTVIQRASDLLDLDNKSELSGYEMFLLLCAIQIHDAGHVIAGRQQHEQNGKELLDYLTADTIEKIFITDIAKVHGGVMANGDKDTINGIDIEAPYHAFTIRLQFLAAILRFADELSDDETRASRYHLIHGGLPESSEVYHAYADALKSVTVAGKEVRLNFIIPAGNITRTYGKNTGKRDSGGNLGIEHVYLIDEIYSRTFKMFCECVYCMRFFPLTLQIKTIRVEIKIHNKYNYIGEPIRYPLTESGYPIFQGQSTLTMCETNLTRGGIILSGEHLEQLVLGAMTPSSVATSNPTV